MSTTQSVPVARVEEVPEGGCLLVELGDMEVGVFNVGGELHAWENRCVHQGGPVCRGDIVPREREVLSEGGESLGVVACEDELHIACPWHGYEYDIRTGRHVGDSRLGLRGVPLRIEEGQVVLELPEQRP